MSFRRLRRDCERRLNELGLPDLYGVETFCLALAARRGRPIRLVPMSLEKAGLWGAWAATDTDDVIFYRASTTPLHRDHIVLHEVCHILCSHHPAQVEGTDWARVLPSLDPGMVRRVLRRSGYHEHEEREAELLASLILQRARFGRAHPPVRLPRRRRWS